MRDDRVVREVEVLRWREGVASREVDKVAEETSVTFHVEPLGILDIVMAPESLQEFILGHLYCEGLVGRREDLVDVSIADRGDRLEALVELDPALVARAQDEGTIDGVHRRGLIQTECGAPPAWPTRALEPIGHRLGMSAEAVSSIPRALRDRTQLFTETGAFHYAFLVDREGTPRLEAWDVGRHTAVDKVVGRALTAGTDLAAHGLYTTGRISSDVARKCVRARIPVVISRGAPLAGAMEIARENQLGMVGFLRGGRFNVYAGEAHFVLD